jgi:hypothetical protein
MNYDLLKAGLELGELLMIDIRPRAQTRLTGVIPGSVNIPGD